MRYSLLACLLAACGPVAAQEVQPDEETTVEDYVAVSELEAVSKIRTRDHDAWSYLTDTVIISTSVRHDKNNMRTAHDTIAGN